jgi:hypothetical protein
MIRILVLVLLAANLLYLGWSRWISEAQPQLVAPEAGTTREQAARSAATAAAPVSACTTIGPVRDETHALEIEQLLGAMQLTPVRRTLTEDVREGWWVYVASPNAAAQARVLRALQNAGIRDAFAMVEDPDLRVSVGLFTEEARAASRADAVRALRLEAVVDERMQQQASVWFDLAGTPRGAVDLSRISAEGVEIQGLRIEECPDATDVSLDTILPQQEAADAAGPG